MSLRLLWAPTISLATAITLASGCGGNAGSTTTGTTTSTTTTATGTGGGGGTGTGGTMGTGGSGGSGGTGCPEDPINPNEELPDLSDPANGTFTMEQALEGLPDGPGPLRAIFDVDVVTDVTTPSKITCELRPDKAPLGVANFVGLARGLRPWKDPGTKKWVKRRFYDGLIFHRVIAGFMAQGGDPLGTGYGGPGYSFAGEIAPDLSHVPGTLAYANPGSNSNGSQFYITETKQTGLDGSYVIFGLCADAESLATVKALTHVQTSQAGPSKDKPLTDQHIKHITITRCAP